MNVRTKVKATLGVTLMLSLSTIGVQSISAPAMASSRVIHAEGTSSGTGDFDTLRAVPQGRHCLILLNQEITWSGDVAGTSKTVGPAKLRFFATCEALEAGESGIPNTYRTVERFVDTEGHETTIRQIGFTDAGVYRGIALFSGHLNGLLHVTGDLASGLPASYEGILVEKG